MRRERLGYVFLQMAEEGEEHPSHRHMPGLVRAILEILDQLERRLQAAVIERVAIIGFHEGPFSAGFSASIARAISRSMIRHKALKKASASRWQSATGQQRKKCSTSASRHSSLT